VSLLEQPLEGYRDEDKDGRLDEVGEDAQPDESGVRDYILTVVAVATAGVDASVFRVSGSLLHAVREWTLILGPLLFLGVNTLMYSSLLFKSRLVPRPLASMGMIGAVLVMLAAFLAMFDIVPPFTPVSGLLAAPIAVYEMLLAGWLIVRGFSSPATASEPARRVTNRLMAAA
jgi:hypothetical protein